ncbi:MAG: cation transporter [Bacteroidetes bacterium]|nr:cation transporter [Bacteroidota bacterium]
MTHTYNVTGMTCTGCEAKVKHLLSQVDGVQTVDIDLTNGDTSITMSKHVDTLTLKNALKDHAKYQLNEKDVQMPKVSPVLFEEDQKSWIETYRPILLVFGYITGITLLVQVTNNSFLWMQWMNHFMAGFFLVFSFFKLLNLTGFAESYAMYDIIAKRWSGYGYLYAFIELGLGIAYLTGFNPIVTNAVTLVVMSISIVGVLQSVLNNQKIKCACLGAVFNLPMSTITIIEDALMIGMSALMLINMI